MHAQHRYEALVHLHNVIESIKDKHPEIAADLIEAKKELEIQEGDHSPAPWKTDYNSYPTILDNEGKIITQLPRNIKKSDLNIIAAAPEMLELLEEIYNSNLAKRFNEKMKAVIKKARGIA